MSYAVPFELSHYTYEEALNTLHAALRFGIEPLVETVVDMLRELGNPDLCFDAIQIAGTNGKTSTSRFSCAILAGEGKRCALYTSPELVSYTERMEVAGAPVSENSFALGIAAAHTAGLRVNAKREASGLKPYDVTEFDLLTVAACVVFALAEVELAVFEVGLGGRWDATSAIASIRSVCVSGIGLDHMHVLGDSLEAIAAEKAAVIQAGRSCVLGVGCATPASVEDVFLAQAAKEGVTPVLVRPTSTEDVPAALEAGQLREHPELPQARYHIVRQPERIGGPLELDVAGIYGNYSELAALKPAYQAPNIASAVALAENYLGRALDSEKLYTSLVRCPTPGRFDLVRPEPLGLVDACHNPQSIRAFLSAVAAIEPERTKRPTLLCAALADKDVRSMVGLLAPEFSCVVTTQTASPRALPAHELAELFAEAGTRAIRETQSVAEALELLANEPYLACGSITLAGEIAAIMR